MQLAIIYFEVEMGYEYKPDDLKAELSDIVYVDAEIAGEIGYGRYMLICQRYIDNGYFGSKNRRLLKLDRPVTSIGFYLVARVDGDYILFNSGERKLKLYTEEIELLKTHKFNFAMFNHIIRNHAFN